MALVPKAFDTLLNERDDLLHVVARTHLELLSVAVELLLGHTKLESTVRYLGIEVDDALEMAEQTEA